MIEVIHANTTIEFANTQDAIIHLKKNPADIRLDLHGVLDILHPTHNLLAKRWEYKIACISFVGNATRDLARKDIQARIQTGQIDYGVLVFCRGRKDRHQFVAEGSKAWVNRHIPHSGKCLFIDDSMDHLRSTESCAEGIECKLFNTGRPEQLVSMLEAWCRNK